MKQHHANFTPTLILACIAALSSVTLAGSPTPAESVKTESNPLSFAGGILTVDIQERIRWEMRENNFDFNDAVRSLTDDNWFLNRARLGLKIKPASWLTIYAQVQDSREWLSDRADFPSVLGAEGDDPFDLRQAYIEIADYAKCPWGLKIGRQLLSYGDERMIGPLEWSNFTRTFDAAKLTYKMKDWSLDAFASTLVTIQRSEYNQSDLFNGNETGRGQVFSGLYFSTTAWGPQMTDIYALHLHENYATGDTNFVSLGLRMKSKPGAFAPKPESGYTKDGKTVITPAASRPIGFDYDFEGVFQTGEVRGKDLTAFAIHAGVGYTFDTAWLPRIGLAYDYGTGDNDPTDGDTETFQNLFPTNHKFYGQMDVFSWQNMHEIEVSFRCNPLKQLTARVEFHAFWLASTDDVWYRTNGVAAVRPLNAAARSASTYAGSEVDVMLTYALSKHVNIEAGYSRFFAGDYLADTGASNDADFAYVQTTFSF